MNLSEQGTLLLWGLLFFAGVVATGVRLLRALRHGLSIRLQVFLSLATTSLMLNAVFAVIMVEHFRARTAELAPGYAARLEAELAPQVVLLGLILGVSAALAAVLIGRVVGAPIERLTRTAERIARGERQAALPVPRGKEVRELTLALESMRRELEERHAIEALVADLSHELKNPIASIQASAEVLEDGAVDDRETALRFARRIRQSAQKLAALTSEMLTLARLEAHGITSQIKQVDLEEVACAAIEAVAPQAHNRGVRLDLEVKEAAQILGETTWLRRALENLLVNAIAHSPRDSAVVVSIGGDSEHAEILVKDQGSGVDPAVRSRLFERFVTSRQEEGGTGLGLAIVRAIAESHGGHAELRETGPQGSTFALVLPRLLHPNLARKPFRLKRGGSALPRGKSKENKDQNIS